MIFVIAVASFSKSCVFILFTRIRNGCVFKSIHFGLHFQIVAFSWTVFIVSVQTEGENGTIWLRFQMKTYPCNRGLRCSTDIFIG